MLVPIKKISKGILWFAASFIIFLGIFSFSLYLVYPNEYAYRYIFWNTSDTQDYLKFPSRSIQKSNTPYFFETQIDSNFYNNFDQINSLDDLDAFLAQNDSTSFIVIQNGKILYEQYFNGNARESIATSFSVAKSINTLLVGIAVEQGYIDDINQPITDFIPELKEKNQEFEKITVRHLLAMNSGLRYHDTKLFGVVDLPWDDNPKTYYYPNLRTLVLDQAEVQHEPGTYFYYNNYNPLLLGMILERATAKTVSQFLEENIWKQIGTEFDTSWSLDDQGFEKMESGINARPIDYAKIGQLILSQGTWQEKQLISREWIQQVTQTNPATSADYYSQVDYLNPPDFYYALGWWVRTTQDSDTPDSYASGHLGQYIFVSPSSQTVIVRTGTDIGTVHWPTLFQQISKKLNANTNQP